MKGYLTGVALIVLVLGLFVITLSQNDSTLMAAGMSWQKLASPGQLSTGHSHLEGDCSACHTTIKGPSTAKCLACHAADERLSIWPELQFHKAAPDCRACHREHQGTGSIGTTMNHDRIGHTVVTEAELRCVTCHLRRDTHDGMFGQQCDSCHETQRWAISEYRHPAATSSSCSQCHRAPPCHFTSHFKKVCGPVAGQLNAIVSDCHSCHQLPSWNSIKEVGWYKSH